MITIIWKKITSFLNNNINLILALFDQLNNNKFISMTPLIWENIWRIDKTKS